MGSWRRFAPHSVGDASHEPSASCKVEGMIPGPGSRLGTHVAVMPPSTTIVCPVVYDEASERR